MAFVTFLCKYTQRRRKSRALRLKSRRLPACLGGGGGGGGARLCAGSRRSSAAARSGFGVVQKILQLLGPQALPHAFLSTWHHVAARACGREPAAYYDARTLYASNSTWQAAAVSPFKNFSVYLLQRQGGCGARHRLSSAAGREGGVAPCVEAFAVNDFQIRTFFLLSRVVHGCGENRRTPCSGSTNSVQHTPSEAAARFELPGAAMPRACRSQRARVAVARRRR